MAKLKGTDRISDLYIELSKEVFRLNSALLNCYEFGRLAEAESILDELNVITRFMNYARNVVE